MVEMASTQRVQVPFSFFYPATVSANQVDEPVIGTAVTITNRDNGNPATLYTSETGLGTLSSLLTTASGTLPPCWVVEGSYLIVAAASGSFTGATVAWEAVRGDGVGNVAANTIGTAQIQAGAVTSGSMAVGAADANVGPLTGPVITGTLPTLTIGSAQITSGMIAPGVLTPAAGSITASMLATGAAASNLGALSGPVIIGSWPTLTIGAGQVTSAMLQGGVGGPPGPQGIQGIPGPQGNQGNQGNPGSTGLFYAGAPQPLQFLYQVNEPFFGAAGGGYYLPGGPSFPTSCIATWVGGIEWFADPTHTTLEPNGGSWVYPSPITNTIQVNYCTTGGWWPVIIYCAIGY